MPPTGSSLNEVHQSIVEGYSRDELRRVVSTCLHANYDLLVSAEKPYADQAFDFVQWAERQGRLQELAACLRRARPKPTPGAPPYKGLAYFGAADAALFFGRATLVAELVAYLKDHRFLAVVGASGSGKSSVVRAGVIPALQAGTTVKGSDRWAVHIVTPTARPLQALAAELTQDSESVTAQATLMDDMAKDPRSLDLFISRLLARTGAPRLLLVVDQFEELFTLCKDRVEQQAYLDNLLAAAVPDGVTAVIFTLRADFYARCAEFANLRTALQDYQKYIGPMAQDELRAVIEAPARQNGWDFEPGLVDAILDDVEGEAGALPLLSHALLETWNRRSERTMTFAGYHAAGGVQGAIAKTADGVYAELSPDQQAIARNIFLRLTTLGEGTEDTRRRAPLPELLGSGDQAAQVQAVLKRLEDERLVMAERANTESAGTEAGAEAVYVDVTHEALIHEWPRLAAWLNEDREGLLVHRRLTDAAQEWQELGRDADTLMRGVRLVQTAEWAAAHDGDLNDLEHAFLAGSQAQLAAENNARELIQREREAAQQRALADAAALAAEQRQRVAEQTVAAQRLRQRNRGLGIALAAALVAVVLAVYFFVQAQDRAAEAQREASAANASATEAVQAKATAQANLSLAQQKLDELKVEELLRSARAKTARLDVDGAIAGFDAAAEAARARGQVLDVSGEVSATIRYAATAYVQEGEKILCEGLFSEPQKCVVPAAGLPAAPITTSVQISPAYLAWAAVAAPQLEGWPAYTSTVQQMAVVSATALYSQALALQPPSDTPVYVWIAPAAFNMGSTDAQCAAVGIGACPADEQPPHTVKLAGYWLQRTEVTNEQYKRCVAAGACLPPDNQFWDKPRAVRLPVTDIDRSQAAVYAAWAGGRLPAEAEWEYACRGAGGRIYPWGDAPPASTQLNYNSEVGGTTEVGTYAPGAHGLYDMAGNVWEWTGGWYGEDDYKHAPEHNPPGPGEGQYSTLRGGSWFESDANFVRCANRYNYLPGSADADIGFRLLSPGQ